MWNIYKNRERIQKFKETGDLQCIYQNELDEACSQHNMAWTYGGFKDPTRRTVLDKILRDKAFNIAKNPYYDGCQRDLASIVYKFFDKKSASLWWSETLATQDKSLSGSVVFKMRKLSNKDLAEELHKPILRKFKKWKVYFSFIDNIWGADFTDMQMISKFNKGFKFL